ncbi:hypothetical protein BDV28DRAFT_138479 [Aspergillus coremiiformis]|uniref:Uncharacterized protein n=1 Tax=Aspergillus coremiiformis TaxID=138285 RepID=A0A5N6YZF3_9EURO|nr:hypothetical protein BDV28DRAFT_138479 [Aspergillus coremiiformis]
MEEVDWLSFWSGSYIFFVSFSLVRTIDGSCPWVHGVPALYAIKLSMGNKFGIVQFRN